MKGMKFALLACAALLVGQSGHAQSCNSCCDWGDIEVGASALLWRVGACDTRYAYSGEYQLGALLQEVGFATADYHYVGSDWDWGVKVFAALDTDCFWVAGDYVWYETTGSSSAKPPPGEVVSLFDGILGGPPGSYLAISGAPGSWAEARASSKVRYQHATLAVGLRGCSTRCCRVDAVALARYLDLDMRMRVEAADPTLLFPVLLAPGATAHSFVGHFGRGGADASFQGGGIGIGLRGACDFVCGLEVVGSFNFFGFFGSSETAHSAFAVEPSENDPPPAEPPWPGALIPQQAYRFENPSRCCWVPGLDAQIALAYGIDCGCTVIKLELGWETHYYFHALRETTAEAFSDFGQLGDLIQGQNSSQLQNSQFNSIAFGGPTFSLRAEF